MRLSGRVDMDARTETGQYSELHMNGRSGTMLCRYNRAARRAEVQELTVASDNSVTVELKALLWRGVAIDGRQLTQALSGWF